MKARQLHQAILMTAPASRRLPIAFLLLLVGCKPPIEYPELVGPETISTGNLYRGAVSPDGQELYFFRKVTEGREDYRIFRSDLVAGLWAEPSPVALGGEFSDMYPAISPDGRFLVFSSYRPAPGDTSANPSAYIWAAERSGEGWGEPRFMADASRFGYYHAQLGFDGEGELHFKRNTWNYRPDAELSTRFSGDWLEIPDSSVVWLGLRHAMPPDVHLWETIPGYDPSYALLIASEIDSDSGRPGPADLWFALRGESGWGRPVSMGYGVNTDKTENFPFFGPDGSMLYFVRDFAQLYRIPVERALASP